MVIGSNPIKCLKVIFNNMLITTNNILLILIILPLLSIFLLLFIPSYNKMLLKVTALTTSCIIFICSLLLWVWFDSSTGLFQFVTKVNWIPFFNINLTLGIDGISLFFILLTTMLTFLCILVSWNSITYNLKEYLIFFLLMEFFLIGVFTTLDLLLFYIFFESVLIPMFLIIGIWGSRERKIRAAYFFFFIHFIRLCFNVTRNFIYLFSNRNN